MPTSTALSNTQLKPWYIITCQTISLFFLSYVMNYLCVIVFSQIAFLNILTQNPRAHFINIAQVPPQLKWRLQLGSLLF